MNVNESVSRLLLFVRSRTACNASAVELAPALVPTSSGGESPQEARAQLLVNLWAQEDEAWYNFLQHARGLVLRGVLTKNNFERLLVASPSRGDYAGLELPDEAMIAEVRSSSSYAVDPRDEEIES